MTHPVSPFAKPLDAAATEAALQESLRAVARHDLPALQRIHDLTAPRMLAELLQVLGDRQAAEAALVDCWVQIWEQASAFNPGRSSAGAWLHAIARHHAITTLRETPLASPEEVDSSIQLLQATLEEQGAPPVQRMLRLAWCSARSPAEIARALRLPLKHVQQEIRSGLVAIQPQPQYSSPPEEVVPANTGFSQRLLEQIAGAYALGTLTLRTSRRFESLMTHDINARRAWQRWEERLAPFSLDIPAVRPPDDAWAAIVRRIEGPAPRAKSPRRWIIAAALLLAAAIAIVWMRRSGN
jgi:DNA-directed RNA polymerase specialized sigma24 family protein